MSVTIVSYVICEKPADYIDKWTGRKWVTKDGKEPEDTGLVLLGSTREEVLRQIPDLHEYDRFIYPHPDECFREEWLGWTDTPDPAWDDLAKAGGIVGAA